MGANASSSKANSKDTTTTKAPPPTRRKAASKTAPKPQQPSGRKLRASTLATRSAYAAQALDSPPPPPPRRRAPKLDSTKETVESAADAAKPKSLLRQPKLPVVKRPRRAKTGWVREKGKSKEEKDAHRFMLASYNEFNGLYRKHVETVEGELTLDEEEALLIDGTLDGFEALYHALSGVEGVRQTDGRVDNLVACSLHLQAMVRAVASSEMLSSYFVEAVSTVSLASRRGFSPKEALAEFDKHLQVITKKRENREAYLKKTAEQGRNGRNKHGNIIVDAKTTVAQRKYGAELWRATATGKRERRYVGPTMTTHALAVKAAADDKKRRNKNRTQRIRGAQKAQGIATPKDCMIAQTLGDGGVPLFITQGHLVPEGSENRPLIAEKAAARAVRHRAEKRMPTCDEKRAERRAAGLPDKVRASDAKSRAGQYYILFCMNKSYPKAIRKKFKDNFSVVKPGTDGYYASTKAAAEVRDEWIELKRPENWIGKERS